MILNTAEALYQAIKQIPMHIRITLKREKFTPYVNDIIGVVTRKITHGKLKEPNRRNDTIEKVWIYNVGCMLETGEIEKE